MLNWDEEVAPALAKAGFVPPPSPMAVPPVQVAPVADQVRSLLRCKLLQN